ncbi:hypothetical protein WN55_05558 [Dufourea novaeangliae]|uniref:Uncharacterized protein n=1 Tax=Dufourea novaeangliae TaxID=178035 RepID=A0A154PN30_DUFNO|nr:hypothetical protein WN55_05558 [Dufourea novaeangliae]
MHSGVRIAVLLQRDLPIRSARRRGDRREIKLVQGLLHAAQQPTAEVKKGEEKTQTKMESDEGEMGKGTSPSHPSRTNLNANWRAMPTTSINSFRLRFRGRDPVPPERLEPRSIDRGILYIYKYSKTKPKTLNFRITR